MNSSVLAFAVLAALFVISLLLLLREGLLRTKARVLIAAGLLAAALAIRGLLLYNETLDYTWFLKEWVQYFRDNGGFTGLRESIGNYNFPYLYFLALFSYIPAYDLYLIKLLSIVFDVVLALGCMKIAGALGGSDAKKLAAFLIAMLLPTPILNGAYWGQCDSIYTAFAVWSIYLALDDRPILSLAAAAISFSFKLQAAFFLPIYLILIFARKIKLRHLPVFPAVFVLTALPAVLLGRPFRDAVLLYIDQAHSTGTAPNYNSVSLFTFIGPLASENRWICQLGIGLAFGFLILLFYWTWKRRGELDERSLLICTALMVTVIPLLLPYMHERYFFMADIFTFVAAVALPRVAAAPVLMSAASLISYLPYLKGRYVINLRYGTVMAAAAAVILTIELALLLRRTERRR